MNHHFICGFHATQSQICQYPDTIIEAWIQTGNHPRLKSLVTRLQALNVCVQQASAQALDQKVQGQRHQGIVLRVKTLPSLSENDLAAILTKTTEPFLLVLDSITDPHNLGACLRSANGAGVHAVIVPKHKSAPLNATALKVSCGAAQTTSLIQVTNLARVLRYLQKQGIWVLGTAGEGTASIYNQSLTGPLALVMGAEDKGLRHLTRQCCDALVHIPMVGDVSSLNVSVATGVCLFEVLRQRQACVS